MTFGLKIIQVKRRLEELELALEKAGFRGSAKDAYSARLRLSEANTSLPKEEQAEPGDDAFVSWAENDAENEERRHQALVEQELRRLRSENETLRAEKAAHHQAALVAARNEPRSKAAQVEKYDGGEHPSTERIAEARARVEAFDLRSVGATSSEYARAGGMSRERASLPDPPRVAAGSAAMGIEPDEQRRVEASTPSEHVGCVNGGGPTCIYLKDGTKIRIERDGARAWLRHVEQDTIGVAAPNAGKTLEALARGFLDNHENSAEWRLPGGARKLLTELLAEVDENAEKRGRAIAGFQIPHRQEDRARGWGARKMGWYYRAVGPDRETAEEALDDCPRERDADRPSQAWIAMPSDRVRFNAGIRCDMLIGACACGATHDERDPTSPVAAPSSGAVAAVPSFRDRAQAFLAPWARPVTNGEPESIDALAGLLATTDALARGEAIEACVRWVSEECGTANGARMARELSADGSSAAGNEQKGKAT